MSAFTPQQQKILLQKMTAALDICERRFADIEKARNTPQGRAEAGARLGAESASSEQQTEAANRRLRKELGDPIFAKSFFAAQRLTRAKILGRQTLVHGRRLA